MEANVEPDDGASARLIWALPCVGPATVPLAPTFQYNSVIRPRRTVLCEWQLTCKRAHLRKERPLRAAVLPSARTPKKIQKTRPTTNEATSQSRHGAFERSVSTAKKLAGSKKKPSAASNFAAACKTTWTRWAAENGKN